MVAIFTGLGAGFAHGSRTSLGAGGLLGQASLGRAGEGVFLNAATGNLVLTQQDEFLAGLGPDVAIARTYNANTTESDDNNDHWRQSTDKRVIFSGTTPGADGSISRIAADGSRVTFTWSAGNIYTTSDLAGEDQIVSYAAGVWTWRDNRNHLTETYAGSTGTSFISTLANDDGKAIAFTYNTNTGRLASIRAQNGSAVEQIEYNWDGNGNLASILTRYQDLAATPSPTNQTLTRTYYAYEEYDEGNPDPNIHSWRLKTVTIDLSPQDGATSDGNVYTTTYTYDSNTLRIARIAQTDGSSLDISYVYDSASNTYRVTRLVQTVAGSATRTTDIAYGSGYSDIISYSQQYVDVNTPHVTTRVAYATSTSTFMSDMTDVTQPMSELTHYTYDSAGRVLTATDPLNKTTTYTYDGAGNLATVTDPNGNVVTRTYDSNNNLTRETRTGTNAGSATASLYTRYVYDSTNHLRYAISAEGRVTAYDYDANGLLSRTTDFPTVAYTIGSSVPLLADMDNWRSGLTATDKANVEITDFHYDLRGNLDWTKSYGVADASGPLTGEGYKLTTFIYDQAGQLLARTVGQPSPGAAGAQNTESFVYDGLGRLILSTDLAGGTTTIVFDDSGALHNGDTTTTVTTAAGYVTVSTYDKAGELIKKSDVVQNQNLNTTTGTANYAYDRLGRLRQSTDATGKKHYFLYDASSHLIADIGEWGEICEYKYDTDGRLIQTVHYANKISSTELSLIAATPAGEWALGTNVTRPSASDSGNLWQWTIYDAGGRIIETIAGDGAATNYEYDNSDRLVKTTTFYNKLSVSGYFTNAPTTATYPTSNANDRITRTFYDGDGRLIGSLNAEGFVSRIVYDSAGRKIQEIAYANAPTGTPASDAFSTIISHITADATKDISTRYVYDGQGFLRFSIDALNHVTEFVYRTVDGAHADQNYAIGLVRETIEHKIALAGATTYTYADVATHIATDSADRISYGVYNAKGQLAYSIDAVGAVTTFAYDVAGRVTKTTQFATTYASALNSAGSSTWLATIDAWAGTQASNSANRITRTWYTERGEVRYVVDAEGYLSQSDYDPEGRLVGQHRYGDRPNVAGTPLVISDATTIANLNSASKGTDSATAYGYDAMGRLYDIQDQVGNHTQRLYYANGLLQDENVAAGSGADESKTRRTYDQAGHLLTVTQGFGAVDAQNQSIAATTTYAYDGLGNVSSITDARSHVTNFTYDKLGRAVIRTDALNNQTTYTYDAFGNVALTVGYTYDANNNPIAHNTFAYYDQLNRLVLTVDAQNLATRTAYTVFSEVESLTRYATAVSAPAVGVQPTTTPNAATDETTGFTYDKLGRAISRTNALGVAAYSQYNAFGELVKHTDEAGNASFIYYDHLGRSTLAIDAEGYATTTTYAPLSRSITRRYVKPTNTGNVDVAPTVTGNANDATTSYVYDAAGRVLSVVQTLTGSENATTLYQYDHRNNVTRVTNALTGYTDRKYDALDRLIEEKVWFDGTGTNTATTTFAYDGNGNLLQKVEAGLRTTSYTYDFDNRLKTVTHDAFLSAASATAALQSATPVEQFFYDGLGNLIEKRDATQARTLYWYDKLGRVSDQLDPASGPGGTATLTHFDYDANNNVKEKKVYATQVTPPTDATGSVPTASGAYRSTQYGYDGLNRLVTVTTPNVETAAYGTSFAVSTGALVTTTTYDALGNVVKVVDANLNATWSYYDKLGHKIAQFDGLNYRTDWTYDADGNVLSEKRWANAGTSAGSSAPVNPGVLPTNLPTADSVNDRVTTFTYDLAGRRLTETRANVKVFHIVATGETSLYPGSAVGDVVYATTNSTVAYTHNALNEVLSKTEASASTETVSYAYDVAGRMTSETHAQFIGYTTTGSHNVVPVTTYAYDGLGDLISTVQSGDSAAGAADRTTLYTYSGGGKLLSVTDAENFVHTYRYDAAGRITRDEYTRQLPSGTSHEATGYDYDAQGRVIHQGVLIDAANTNAWSRAGTAIDTTSIKYNSFGEVAQRGLIHYDPSTGAVTSELYPETFDYDGAGRLWRTTSGDGTTKYFMYDAAGNQTLMVASTGTDISAGAGYSTIDSVLNLWGATRANIGTNFVSGIVATITRYDARNQAIEVKEPQREINTTTKSDLSTTRAYNAFGEVSYEINALSARVDYAYNTMGRLIQTQSPAVSITSATGVVTTNYRPTENYYYDVSGRRVAAKDANGNLTQYTLLAGSGYNGKAALIAQTKFADSNTITTSYDIFGEARKITDQLGRIDSQTFDKMGRLTQLDRPAGAAGTLSQYFQYDGFGQRIKNWNSQLTSSNAQTTTYDAQGRVTQTVAQGGDTTGYAYAWDATIATSGMATFGGWTQTTTYANSKTLVEKGDYFHHNTQTTDLGGHVSGFTYNKAGLITQRSGGSALNYTYFNSNRIASASTTVGANTRTTSYEYDATGDLTKEVTTETGGHTYENATATYDALGRMLSWIETGSSDTPHSTLTYEYDANGNIRHEANTYRVLDATGVAASTDTSKDLWYLYDALNRVTTAPGVSITYDAAGQRMATYTSFADQQVLSDPETHTHYTVYFTNERDEFYTYDTAGRVTQIKAETGYYDDSGYTPPDGDPAYATLQSSFSYDALGRLTSESDVNNFSRALTYNAKGQITYEVDSTIRGTITYVAQTTTNYGSGTSYALGAPTEITTVNFENNTQKLTTHSANTYAWWGGAVTSSIVYDPDYTHSHPNMWTSTYNYTQVGGQARLDSVTIADGRPRTVSYRSDLSFQVIRRDESDNVSTQGDPHEIWYRFGGREIGYVGNNGTANITDVASVHERVATQGTGAFRDGATTPSAYSDYDGAYDALNSFNQGSSASSYTVQAGDTLSGIAAQLWGDANLWYKLAEINGLTGDETLVENTILTIPAGVMRSSNTAATFTPYDPNETLGSTAPTAAKPPKHPHNCGVLGQILLAVVAIAVVALVHVPIQGFFAGLFQVGSATSGLAVTAAGIATGAAEEAVGSIVSQGIGVATGIQDKFSWSAVGMAAISGGVSGSGVGNAIASKVASGQFAQAFVSGAVNNAISQGIGMAVGLQGKFSWASVAAAGVSAGVSREIGSALHTTPLSVDPSAHNFVGNILTATAADIAGAATRSIVDGSDFGDNILASLPDAIGSTLGQELVSYASMSPVERRFGAGAYNEAQRETGRDYSVDAQDRPFWQDWAAAIGGLLNGVGDALGLHGVQAFHHAWTGGSDTYDQSDAMMLTVMGHRDPVNDYEQGVQSLIQSLPERDRRPAATYIGVAEGAVTRAHAVIDGAVDFGRWSLGIGPVGWATDYFSGGHTPSYLPSFASSRAGLDAFGNSVSTGFHDMMANSGQFFGDAWHDTVIAPIDAFNADIAAGRYREAGRIVGGAGVDAALWAAPVAKGVSLLRGGEVIAAGVEAEAEIGAQGSVFGDRIQWTATRLRGTSQTYGVVTRTDIDWDMTRTNGPAEFVGRTNAEAAASGFAPELGDGNFATLHHVGQDARGPLVEGSTRYHGVGKPGQDALHGLYGRNAPHPEYPIDRRAFAVDTREYWQWRVRNRNP
jgi:YD repeat-containing protein